MLSSISSLNPICALSIAARTFVEEFGETRNPGRGAVLMTRVIAAAMALFQIRPSSLVYI